MGEELFRAVAEMAGQDVRREEEGGVVAGEAVAVVERLEVVQVGPAERERTAGLEERLGPPRQ